VARVTVGLDRIVIVIKSSAFSKLAGQYLNVSVVGQHPEYDIVVPFTNTRGRKGSVILRHSDTKRDIFDLPQEELKKLVQEVIWRDEHFGGKILKYIAKREQASDSHVGKCILRAFEILQMSA
jgi:hypothetical protein